MADPAPSDLQVFQRVVRSRRSVRRFTDEPIPDEVVQDCLDLALLAPNSSNLQPWAFYRIVDPAKRRAMVPICLNQNAARTAAELIVVVARTDTWKQHCTDVLDHWPEATIPRIVETYYRKGARLHYGRLPLDPLGRIKKILRNVMGLRGPAPRWPNSAADMKLWACKSTALAAENLMLAFRAHGYDTCPMEGFDEARVRKLLKLPRQAFVVMVVAAGRRGPKGVYHEQFRLPRERFVFEV